MAWYPALRSRSTDPFSHRHDRVRGHAGRQILRGLESRRDRPGIDDLRAVALLDPADLMLAKTAVESRDDDD